MPTSPRELTGGTGWYQPTALFSNLRADEGHRPLREREDFTAHRGTAEYFRGPLHTRPCGATLSKQERAGIRRMRGGSRSVLRPAPHPSRALPGPPSPRRGFSPHPARAAPGPPSPEGKASSGGGMIPAPYYWQGLQYQPFQGFFQVFLVYAGIIDDQAVQVCGLGIKGAEGLDLQALGEEGLGQGFV
mgnify:CR=1 FL=1